MKKNVVFHRSTSLPSFWKQDVRFGGFISMFVGNFQQLQPVDDISIYKEGGYGNTLFEFI